MPAGQLLLHCSSRALPVEQAAQPLLKDRLIGDGKEGKRARCVPAIRGHQGGIDPIEGGAAHHAKEKRAHSASTIFSASGMAAERPAAASARAANRTSATDVPANWAITPSPPNKRAASPTRELEKATLSGLCAAGAASTR